jgi:hypothetical protein
MYLFSEEIFRGTTGYLCSYFRMPCISQLTARWTTWFQITSYNSQTRLISNELQHWETVLQAPPAFRRSALSTLFIYNQNPYFRLVVRSFEIFHHVSTTFHALLFLSFDSAPSFRSVCVQKSFAVILFILLYVCIYIYIVCYLAFARIRKLYIVRYLRFSAAKMHLQAKKKTGFRISTSSGFRQCSRP